MSSTYWYVPFLCRGCAYSEPCMDPSIKRVRVPVCVWGGGSSPLINQNFMEPNTKESTLKFDPNLVSVRNHLQSWYNWFEIEQTRSCLQYCWISKPQASHLPLKIASVLDIVLLLTKRKKILECRCVKCKQMAKDKVDPEVSNSQRGSQDRTPTGLSLFLPPPALHHLLFAQKNGRGLHSICQGPCLDGRCWC